MGVSGVCVGSIWPRRGPGVHRVNLERDHIVRSIVYGCSASAAKRKYYKSATMNPKQLLVCCVLVFSSLVSLHLPAESAPTRERLEFADSTSDTNPLQRDKLRALLDSNSTNSDVAAEGYWMLRGLSSLTCDACEFAVRILLDLFHIGKEWDYLATAVGDLCYVLKIEDRNVCMPITQLFKDEVFTVFSKVALSPKEACGVLLGPPCGDGYNPWMQNWTVTVPENKPPVTPVPPPKPGSPVIRILHLSDIHVDLAYTPGLTNDCGEPLCCRVPNPPGNGSTAAGNWGDYNCDVPYQTLENLMEFLGNMSDDFDLVYWTGDLPAHNVWNQSREDQLTVQKKVVELMQKNFPAGKLVFPTLGNHESSPVNSFPPPFITGDQSLQWLLDAYSQNWSVWLQKLPGWSTVEQSIKYGGFYNMKVFEGLRVISLQTNYCNTGNYWLLINSTDPGGQLKWLIQQLLAAEENGEKVHIIGHIPPGESCFKPWGVNFHKIVNRFESTIIGQFYGHTHTDSFKVFFDDDNMTRATSIAYIGPGVTSYQGLNMGFRIYTMDGNYTGTTYQLMDHESYYMNITDANLTNQPKWLLEYSAKDAYDMKALQPEDWADLVSRFEKDDLLFQKFFSYYYKMHSPPVCNASCKSDKICGLLSSGSGGPSLCSAELHQ